MDIQEHVYCGMRVQYLNERGEMYQVKYAVLVNAQPLPMSNLARRESSDGYAWGYAGCGPRALAHSMLAHEFGEAIADRYFEPFTWKVVDGLGYGRNNEAWRLTSVDLRRWLEQRTAIDGDVLAMAPSTTNTVSTVYGIAAYE